MKRQFLHEHHNRQERAWYPRGNGGPYGGLNYSPTAIRPSEAHRRRLKSDYLTIFQNYVRSCRFMISGHLFKFTYTAASFAAANNLPLHQSHRSFAKVLTDANKRLQTALTALQRTPLEYAHAYINGRLEVFAVLACPRVWTILPPDFTDRRTEHQVALWNQIACPPQSLPPSKKPSPVAP